MTDKPKIGVEVNINTNASSKSTQPELKTPKSTAPETSPDSPFCIAVLGDFSGHGNGPLDQSGSPSRRRLIEVDRDNFEEVMAALDISLNLKLNNNDVIQVDIKAPDDFHPDGLYENLESFSQLRSLRRRLKNNNSFAEAAAEIQGWYSADDSVSTKPVVEDIEPGSNQSAEALTENLLDSILDSQQPTSAASTEAAQINSLIKSIVAPYVEPVADPRQDEMIAMLDKATEKHMRDILHHTDFQAMESAWESLYFLIKRLETGRKLKIMLLDINKQALQVELAVDDITSSAIYKMFCDPAEGDMPWSILLGNYTFSASIDDVLSLASIGEIAQQAKAPFIAAASEPLAGCESFAKTADYEDWTYTISEGVSQAWKMLRQSPVAPYIGLALPRFLLRLPYGQKSGPIESFVFEEMPEEHCHACYLWGNAAFLKAELLARNFLTHGWNMQPEKVSQTDNLPVHFYIEEGETVGKPVAEILLTERGAEILSKQGLMPVWSVRNADSVRSADYRSIDQDGQKLSGRWL